ncbi:hypothetical protein DERP_009607, partial [Dermatophagoides pteronyssinus]
MAINLILFDIGNIHSSSNKNCEIRVDIGLWELLYSDDQHYLNCKYYMLSDFHGYRLFMIYV